jgi:hypothetical protein
MLMDAAIYKMHRYNAKHNFISIKHATKSIVWGKLTK